MLFRELLSYLDKKDIFNGIVSAVVFLALSLIFQLLRSQAPKVRKYLRKFRARYLLKLRKKRFDQRYFAYQVSKENCLFILETFARNSPFARGIPPNRKKTKNGNEISKTMAKSWIKSPNGC